MVGCSSAPDQLSFGTPNHTCKDESIGDSCSPSDDVMMSHISNRCASELLAAGSEKFFVPCVNIGRFLRYRRETEGSAR